MLDSKATVLDHLPIERGRFEDALAEISDADKVEVWVEEEWTTKDLMAHITAWEQLLLRWFDMFAQGESPPIPGPGQWDEYIERFNAEVYEANRDRTLAEVTAHWHQVYQQLVAAIQALPEDSNDEYWSRWGIEAPWSFFAEYHLHYAHHFQSLKAWLDRS